MREILFRGKRKDNGEWVYGCFVKSLSSTVHGYIMESHTDMPAAKVILKTVGQYIGKTDKNGQKIFTDDIVRFKVFDNTFIGEIAFNTETLANDIRFNLVTISGETKTHRILCSLCDDIEVIGNVFDNPELLEV